MNFRHKSILDGLMRGSEVPQPDWYYFLELERIKPNSYKRIWFYLDNICQKDHSHIPETTKLDKETFIKRVKKTRNPKLSRLLYQKLDTKSLGLIVEDDDDTAIVS